MIRILLTGIMFCLSSVLLYGKHEWEVLTEQEVASLQKEADDFIDEITDGRQDRQADAVLHAIDGSTSELNQLRESRNKGIIYSRNVEVKDITPADGVARGINMRIYRPKDAHDSSLPLLIYFHGGGWTFGGLNSCAGFCDALAAKGEVAVLAVEYSLAPENSFPRGLTDCVAAVEYAFEMAGELGVSPQKISLGGDSSGGNLALATALCMADIRPEYDLRSLVLFYPVVSAESGNEGSWKEYSRGYGLDRRLMEAFIHAYDGRGGASSTIGSLSGAELKSPAVARDDMLRQLPPILMVAAERDILADQGVEFASHLKRLGNDIERVEFPGSVHLFITVPGQDTAFRKSVELTNRFLTH